ncbi:isochorismatase family protein [Pleionea mediterranea]|uniref:nicotinamidase n=1 Tax=Pleionea mediterranea TaxID=523701 RepID=A0A316G611_9GAMM|nr:isochorismatase family protein [Pleionea mediterranea]PWK49867.1 nicotinamidase/pyrazinamidase [Pleionea mediterranea]
MNKIASFDVDPQYGFTEECPKELPVPGGLEIVGPLNEQAKLTDYRLGSKDAHSPKAEWVATEEEPQLTAITNKGADIDLRWNLHAVPGTRGFEYIEGLPKPAEYDFFVWKGVEPTMHPYSAVYHDLAKKRSTGVIEWLQCNDVTTVIVGGLATDFCVKETVVDLCNAGFRVILNMAATRGIADETVAAALKEIAQAGAEVVCNTDELKAVLA